MNPAIGTRPGRPLLQSHGGREGGMSGDDQNGKSLARARFLTLRHDPPQLWAEVAVAKFHEGVTALEINSKGVSASEPEGRPSAAANKPSLASPVESRTV